MTIASYQVGSTANPSKESEDSKQPSFSTWGSFTESRLFSKLPREEKSRRSAKFLLNDKNTTIFNLKYHKGFLIFVSGKGMEILHYFKPFLQKKKTIKKAGWLLLIPFGSLTLKIEFGHVFLVMIIKLTWKQLFSYNRKAGFLWCPVSVPNRNCDLPITGPHTTIIL